MLVVEAGVAFWVRRISVNSQTSPSYKRLNTVVQETDDEEEIMFLLILLLGQKSVTLTELITIHCY